MSAAHLLERARSVEIALHVPAVCFTEARGVITREGKFAPKTEANALRHYVRWAREKQRISDSDADVVFRVVNQYEAQVRT